MDMPRLAQFAARAGPGFRSRAAGHEGQLAFGATRLVISGHRGSRKRRISTGFHEEIMQVPA